MLSLLSQQDVQSITFELCGSKFGELVKYNFSSGLIPLFSTTFTGQIRPYMFDPSSLMLSGDSEGVDEEFWNRLHWVISPVGPIDIDKFEVEVEKLIQQY